MIKFSVLVSVYKDDDVGFLQEALHSIYEMQTLKPDEIVVVFDGPLTSMLYQMIGEFRSGKESIVKMVPLEQNGGLGEALRVGVDHCSYDYIMRMDSDDVSDAKRFEKQIAYMQQHPQIDVLGTYIGEFREEWRNEDMRVRRVPKGYKDICRMARKRNPMNHVSVCIKKSALQKCGGYEPVSLVEDYYLWLKMIVHHCVLENIGDVLVYVRAGNDFSAKRGAKERIRGWKVLQAYMLENHMISRLGSYMNMMYIRIFTNLPPGLRGMVYAHILRRHSSRYGKVVAISKKA